ncbi:MAG: tRNA (guanosine(46)-N7)-methyltransferase TrmB [Hyphomicrobiales bacterium]|nr:tRNA (guanosine(46)-N7)-methyltransferase TrmB [Hyphomicrobiales bacterium]
MSEAAQRGAFYGRRQGKRLRPKQAAGISGTLPNLQIDCSGPVRPDALFASDKTAYWLEIGFGGGEHLINNASLHPDIGHLGCEPFINGMAKLVLLIEKEGIDAIRLHNDDAVQLLDQLPDASLDRIYLLYPDPWPKRRHNKRRFVSDENLSRMARVLKPGGEFRFASDIDHYVGWTLARILRSPDFVWTAEQPDDWRLPWENWPSTRYEAKAIREGRKSSYLIAKRR